MRIKRLIRWCDCTQDSLGGRKGWSFDPKQGTHVHHDCGRPSKAVLDLLDSSDLHPRRP